MWCDVKSCISIYLASYPPNHLCIYLSIYLTIYLSSYRLFFIPWYEFAIPCLHLDWRLKIPQKLFPQIFNPPNLRGGLTIRRRNPVESSIWRGKGFHPSTHSIPFHPSVHPIHPPILSIHPSFPFIYIAICSPICLSTYIYLPIYLAIYLSIHPSNYILSYNVAILGLHVDWRSKKEQSSIQRRVQGVPTTRSIEKPFSRHARQPVFKQFKPTIKQNCTGFDTY